MKKQFNKKSAAILLAMTMLAGSIGFTSCQTTENSTGNPDSSVVVPSSYKVTFHYDFDGGYNAETKRPETYKKTEVLVSENGEGVTVSRALQRKFNSVEGYEVCGYSTDTWKEGVTGDMDVYVLYEPLPTYGVTFKNIDGSVIETVYVPQGTELVAADFPANVTYLINTASYNALSNTAKAAYEAYTAKSGWYILTAHKTGYIAIETGKVFAGFTGSMGDFTQDVVMTATDKAADVQLKKTSASITVDGTKDANYTHVMSLPYRFSSTDCTILLEYATLEAATQAGKGDEWTKAKAAYDKVEAQNYAMETYMAWDGDWIYYFIEVTKPNVGSIGKTGMDAIGSNPRNDGIEIWYNLGGSLGTFAIDAFGYDVVFPGANYSYEKNFSYATKLVGTDFNVATWDGNAVMTGGTGYTIEVKIPAYANMFEEVTTNIGGEGWGTKAVNGMPIIVSPDLKSIASAPSASDIQTMVETGSADSVRDNYGFKDMGGGWTLNTPNTAKSDYRKFEKTVVFVD